MQTRLLTLTLALFAFVTYGQTSIPDSFFETYLETHDASGATVNLGDPSSMGDGIYNNSVPTAKINSVTSLLIPLQSITDLTGIEDFEALQTLNCWGNPLGTLNLSSNINLVQLYCYNCSLTSLTLPSTGTLQHVECFNNNLMSLVTSGNPNLANLFCNVNPNLGSLDLANNTALTTLECRNCGLTELDVTNNIALLALRCQQNSISNINLSNNTLLLDLSLRFNSLTQLDVTKTTQLASLNCSLNALTQLNIKNGHNDLLTSLDATDNNLSCIQVDNKTAAEGYGGWLIDGGVTYEEACPGLGTDKFDLSSTTMYPNPVKYGINIDTDFVSMYRLLSIHGQELSTGTLVSGNNKLDLSSLSNGLYLLHVENDHGFTSKKIIKY